MFEFSLFVSPNLEFSIFGAPNLGFLKFEFSTFGRFTQKRSNLGQESKHHFWVGI